MSFILAKERDEDCRAAFEHYAAYLEVRKHCFPPKAFALATSDWYFGFDDHRAPHDAWLETFSIEEVRSYEGESAPATSITIKLLGAYHDGYIEFRYSGVIAYSMSSLNLTRGHSDWRYDEFRISDSGALIHEIQWWGMGQSATWLIEAADVQHSWHPFDAGNPPSAPQN